MDACVQTEEKLQTEPQKQQHTCSFAHMQLFLCQIWSNLMTQIDTSRIARFKPSPARCPCLNKAWACSKFCGCAQKQVCECECVFAALWLHHSRKSAGRWGEFSRKALTDLVVSILRQKAIARLHLFHWTSTMKKKKKKKKGHAVVSLPTGAHKLQKRMFLKTGFWKKMLALIVKEIVSLLSVCFIFSLFHE